MLFRLGAPPCHQRELATQPQGIVAVDQRIVDDLRQLALGAGQIASVISMIRRTQMGCRCSCSRRIAPRRLSRRLCRWGRLRWLFAFGPCSWRCRSSTDGEGSDTNRLKPALPRRNTHEVSIPLAIRNPSFCCLPLTLGAPRDPAGRTLLAARTKPDAAAVASGPARRTFRLQRQKTRLDW